MKAGGYLIFILCIGVSQVFASKSIVTFKSERGNNLQVVIDGKTINSKLKPTVKIKTSPGLHDLKIQVYDNEGTCLNELEEPAVLPAGFRTVYKIIEYSAEGCMELQRIDFSQIYVEQLRSPDRFFNKRMIAAHGDLMTPGNNIKLTNHFFLRQPALPKTLA